MMLIPLKIKTLIAIPLLLPAFSVVANISAPHQWMTLKTNGVTSWLVSPKMLTEQGIFYYSNGQPMPENGSVRVAGNYTLGWGFSQGDDFNVSYTLTAQFPTLSNSRRLKFSGKSCVFIITAKGIAQPDVRVNNFNGAACSYHDDGQGGQFNLN